MGTDRKREEDDRENKVCMLQLGANNKGTSRDYHCNLTNRCNSI